jgi:hypothetical protein
MSEQQPWGSDVIARYLTVAGSSLSREDLTVDITYASHSGLLTATCNGCGDTEWTSTGGRTYDPPEKEDERVEKALPESRLLAQTHAEKCRAMPPPAVAAEPTTPTPDDGSLTNNPSGALFCAAAAIGLAAAREQQDNPLTDDERAAHDDYQQAARAHGYTDEQIRAHVKTLGRPAVTQ